MGLWGSLWGRSWDQGTARRGLNAFSRIETEDSEVSVRCGPALSDLRAALPWMRLWDSWPALFLDSGRGDTGNSLRWFSGTLDSSPKISSFLTPGLEPPLDKDPSWLVLGQGQDLALVESEGGWQPTTHPLCICLDLPACPRPCPGLGALPDPVRTSLLLPSTPVTGRSLAWAQAQLTTPSPRLGLIGPTGRGQEPVDGRQGRAASGMEGGHS